MNDAVRTSLVLLLAALSACSKKAEAPAPLTPTLQSQDAPKPAPGEILSATVTAAGIPATYEARFEGGQLARVDEVRTNADGDQSSGAYEFRGARLLKYSGPAIGASTQLDLAFDMQGRTTKAQAGARDATAEEIDAVKERAQLLRSHALAQSSVRTHESAEATSH